jgi:hypothetical protein
MDGCDYSLFGYLALRGKAWPSCQPASASATGRSERRVAGRAGPVAPVQRCTALQPTPHAYTLDSRGRRDEDEAVGNKQNTCMHDAHDMTTCTTLTLHS